MTRGALIPAVYAKALQMNNSASMSAKTVTLMSADCERIVRGMIDLHELWANITQVALATWLIEVQLGVACVAPVAVTLGLFSSDCLSHLASPTDWHGYSNDWVDWLRYNACAQISKVMD